MRARIRSEMRWDNQVYCTKVRPLWTNFLLLHLYQQLIKGTEATKQNRIGKNKNPKIIIYLINYKLIRCHGYFLQSTKCGLRELISRACPFFVKYWIKICPPCLLFFIFWPGFIWLIFSEKKSSADCILKTIQGG